jgi:hypothetical protein
LSDRTNRWRNGFFGLIPVAALVGAVLHFGEIERFALLLREAEPGWLGLAVLMQVSPTPASLPVVRRCSGAPGRQGPCRG